MSAASRVSGKVHKWLALVMAVPIMFWFVSGLFFAVFPIEKVRSEHLIAEAPPVAISLDQAGEGLRRIAAQGAAPGDRIELRAMLGRPVVLVSAGEERPRLYHLATGRQLSPISPSLAAVIAERDHAGDQRARRVELVTEGSTEYRGALPAWRVDFDDGADRALYVAVDTGAVAARRSNLWRTFDFLWSLHILDLKNHEDFNTPLLIIATALGLVVIVTGFVMFPSRLGYNSWRRRRRRARKRTDTGPAPAAAE
ncbi:MAG TPA: PepSY domain-containing protein [Allosphingosinicella sp.]|nr:PepSY domain-containing protein [Allosphingosinicella sp.]